MHQYTMTSEIYSWSQISGWFRAWHMVGMFVACTSCSKWIFIFLFFAICMLWYVSTLNKTLFIYFIYLLTNHAGFTFSIN
jgi:hypothetical protein